MTRKSKLSQECWNIDYSFIKWLNKHLKVYKKEAKIDLNYHKFTFKNKEYTQLELIDKMIDLSNYLIKEYYGAEEELYDKSDELLDIFKTTFYSLWW